MYTGDQKELVCVLQLQSSQTLNVMLNAGLIYSVMKLVSHTFEFHKPVVGQT